MKTDYIYNMAAGEELDILIAKEIFGQTDFEHLEATWFEYATSNGNDGYDGWECPRCHTSEGSGKKCVTHYSGNISAAWEVVEKINEKWSMRVISYYQSDCVANIWNVRGFDKEYHARADTVPLAICRAALLSVLGL